MSPTKTPHPLTKLHHNRVKAAFHRFRHIFAFMGGPRASTVRQREQGQRCALCDTYIGGPISARVTWRYCESCQPTTRRIYMSYFVRGGQWICGFLEADLKTSIGRGRLFGSADKLRELIARTPTKMLSEDKNAFEHGIDKGRGGVWLELTAEQYAKLNGSR